MKRDFQIQFVRSMGLERHERFLDLGCGTLRGGIPFIDYLEPGRYYGIDVRDSVVGEARKELQRAGLQKKDAHIEWVPMISSKSLDVSFDLIWSFSVLIHLSDAGLEEVLEFVSRHLSADGRYLANVNLGVRSPGSWKEFPVVWRSFEFYGDTAANHHLRVRDLGALSTLGHLSGDPLQDSQHMLLFERSR